MFPCERCGCCCRLAGHTIWGKSMADANGICKYLDQEKNLCTIYENRPDICRVDLMYDRLYQDQMSREAFYAMNKDVCRQLQEKSGIRHVEPLPSEVT
ncbi:MAG: YkgJ family cysteine cluster protein [Selenomonadaceae bacterium]|nr:YkgJ family cysteine cluster protein [Selenomonadaceae bacterium]